MEKCQRETCFAPEIGCDLGNTNLSNCPLWRGAQQNETIEGDYSEEVRLPWSGSALGLADLGFVSGRKRPIIIGVVGPQNAGKTTLLAAWYLLVGRGLASLGGRLFSGSYTLSGWEAVAGAMRWSPGHTPGFPAHTTSRGGRAPGMLHLAFKREDGRSIDYLFTDAPGEWFQKWALNAGSPEGEGARWISTNADAFLIIADREALSGQSMGSARGSLQFLAKRLGAELGDRPVALVWTKADVKIAPEMETAVRRAVGNAMPSFDEHYVSVVEEVDADHHHNNGQALTRLLRWALDIERPKINLPPLKTTSSDPFFMLGESQ
ncbi:TRAFAC clade GTPase domain-containing protein [Rhizobium sp. SL42]|uniref:TRAFAC clade GTPase domain-containing protein n=1 Tax=Rhizobium sp. SL42 TaxID=2806346 RepID=UPI001F194518|nr:hypothetical protein [Rhizobium sp. SL42]UJW77683.1 hypothetical protein IM739_22445 [Rhizobium sp. SL42]